MLELSYTDIYKHYKLKDFTQWEGWKLALEIAKRIPSNRYDYTPAKTIQYMTNGHTIESWVKNTFSGMEFLDNTHDTFHEGWGTNKPDLIDASGATIEVKWYQSMQSAEKNVLSPLTSEATALDIYNNVLHAPDWLFLYIRDENALYSVYLKDFVKTRSLSKPQFVMFVPRQDVPAIFLEDSYFNKEEDKKDEN